MMIHSPILTRNASIAFLLTSAAVAALFAWSLSLLPVSAPSARKPPAVAYCPGSKLNLDKQKFCPVTHQRYERDPALIALSATMLIPQNKDNTPETITPPLDATAITIGIPSAPALKERDRIKFISEPRPLPPLAAIDFKEAAVRQRPSPAPPCHVDLIGDWKGRSVDLSPIASLDEPAVPWSLTAVLHYDESGHVQHALVETTTLDWPLRTEIARRLYRCRVTPGSSPGEGRLVISGPGHRSRP